MNNMTFRPVGTAVAVAALAVVAVMLVMTVPASAQSDEQLAASTSCHNATDPERIAAWQELGTPSCDEVAAARERLEAAERGYSVGATPPRCAWYGGPDGEGETVAYRIDDNCSGEYSDGDTVYAPWMTTRRQTPDQQDRNRGVTGQGVTAWGEVYPEVDKDHAGYANDRSLRTDGYVVGTEVVINASDASLGGGIIRLYEIVEEVEILADGTRVTRLRYRLPDGSVVSSPGGEVTPSSVCLRTPYTGPGERCTTKHQVTFGGSTYELEEAVDPYQSDGRVLVNITCISGACKQTST